VRTHGDAPGECARFVSVSGHVEYYFKGAEKRLTYPWAKGLKVENIQAYHDEGARQGRQVRFLRLEARRLRSAGAEAQHPEFEMWSQGITRAPGGAAPTCHMPYVVSGAQKISDHHIRSPLFTSIGACQTCHKWSEAE